MRIRFSAVALILGTAVSICHSAADDWQIVRSRKTGHATFVSRPGGAIPVTSNVAAVPEPLDFFRQHGALFGIENADHQLRLRRSEKDLLGDVHTEFQQIHRGIRVFGARVRTHQNAAGQFLSANGNAFSISPKLDVVPDLGRFLIETIVREAFASETAILEQLELVIVDPGWYGDRPQGERLAWYVRVADWPGWKAEAFFIDADSGHILDRWNLVETIRNRRIHNGNSSTALPGPVARSEGQGPNSDEDVNLAYDYTGDTYDYYWRGFGRDSFNGSGGMMIATVNTTATPCPNAFWNGFQAAYCTGMAHDDVVGHEITHAVVQYTADLIYQNQPGQLNESFADVFGELVDLFNGDASLPGPPAGLPWPTHLSGPHFDTSNNARTSCIGGVHLQVLQPSGIAGLYFAGEALFGPPLDLNGVTGVVVETTPANGCGEITNDIAGKIALIDRGGCDFSAKTFQAEAAGAIGVIIANNREGPLPFLPGDDPGVTIPSVGITQDDGNRIRTALETSPVVATLAANDTTGVRWLISEDGVGGQFRDMWMPSCEGHPDTANHPFQTCSPFDNGGVHSGSGVPNHAFALVTDGGTFNGFEVEAIGAIKSGAVWYRALTTYLTEVSDFEDAFAGLHQSALDIVGTFPLDPRTGFPSASEFTAHDAEQVHLALQAVEMNTPGRCGSFDSVLDPDPYVACDTVVSMYSDDFESGGIDWTVSNSNPPTAYDWQIRSGLPGGHPGQAFFAADPDIGNCATEGESGVHSLLSPVLFVWDEAQFFFLSFAHLVATEPAYDGGNLKISVNEGPFELIPADRYSFNAYNAVIPKDSINPLAGEPAFTGRGAVWGTSYVNLSDLANGGDLVQFRFDFGKDACSGEDGWYIDDVHLFYCIPDANGDFDFDGKVTLLDVAAFQNCMFESVRSGGPCVPADLDGSGFITSLDFPGLIKLMGDP